MKDRENRTMAGVLLEQRQRILRAAHRTMAGVMLLGLISCSGMNHQNLQRRDIHDYSVAPETLDYFLSPLPSWANYSTAGECQRKRVLQYVDLNKIQASFQLTYEQAVQFQYSLNQRYEELIKELGLANISLEEQAKIFYETLEAIRGSRKIFKATQYPQVSLVWIDDALKSEERMSALSHLIKSPEMEAAPVFLVSLCLSHGEMETLIKDKGLQDVVMGFIPYEMFSIFGQDRQVMTVMGLHFPSLFAPGQQLRLYSPKGLLPKEFMGLSKVQAY